MKTIIYTGIVLFSAASVYGFTDYYSSKKNGIFNTLYKENDNQEIGYPALKTVPFVTGKYASVLTQHKEVSNKEKEALADELKKNLPVKLERKIYLEDFSRGRIRPDIKVEDIKTLEAYDTLVVVPVVADTAFKQ